VKFIVEHKKRYSISISNNILFCVYILINNHLFDDFLKKKIVASPSECFCTISENFQNSEDNQRLLGRFE